MKKRLFIRTLQLLGILLFSLTFVQKLQAIEGVCVPTPPCYCNPECFRCGPGGCSQSTSPSYQQPSGPTPEQLEQRRVDEERQRQDEIEAQKKAVEAEAAAKKKQEEFENNKRDALREMKGASGRDDGLKGVDSGDLELKGIGDSNKGHMELKGLESNKAIKEAEGSLYNTKENKTPEAVFDTKGGKSPHSYLTVAVPATGAPVELSDRAKKDPRMIKTLKELEKLQIKRQELDAERTRLARERNSAKDPEQMKQLTQKLDKAESDYQSNLLSASKTYDKVEKLKRTIDTEVEGSNK
ncbi:MAG TPA: hypothetical protein VMU29_02225 [Smithella sp.]|nr:hypothetical protein [Smithella sp.]